MTYRPRITGIRRAAPAAAGVVLLLAGCTAQANLTVPAEDVAELAVTALEEQWDVMPEVDCGSESVDLVEGTALECSAYNPNSGLDYPADVTITEVDGTRYSIDVSVGQAISDSDDGSDAGAEAPAEAPVVTAASVADLAATALEPELGYRPTVDCGTEGIAIYVDAVIDCVSTADSGVAYPATVTVTEVTSANYDIDVVVGSSPVG